MVEKIRQAINIKATDYPLNIFNLCNCINDIEIGRMPFTNGDLRGLVCIAKNKGENHVIIVNSNKSSYEQNYHGCHEFMHIFTTNEPGITINCFEKIKPNQNSYIEWLANEGAAELLVPYKILLPMVKKNYNSMTKGIGTSQFCEEAAQHFFVSSRVIQYRIDSLKYEISQYMDGVSLDKIEILSNTRLIQRGIVIKSLVDLEKERLNAMWEHTHKPSNNAGFTVDYHKIAYQYY